MRARCCPGSAPRDFWSATCFGFGFGFGFRVSGFGFRGLGFGFRVSGFGFRVSDFQFWAQKEFRMFKTMSSYRGAHSAQRSPSRRQETCSSPPSPPNQTRNSVPDRICVCSSLGRKALLHLLVLSDFRGPGSPLGSL